MARWKASIAVRCSAVYEVEVEADTYEEAEDAAINEAANRYNSMDVTVDDYDVDSLESTNGAD